VPRILVVVTVPAVAQEWLSQSEEEMVLRHCGYWISLRGGSRNGEHPLRDGDHSAPETSFRCRSPPAFDGDAMKVSIRDESTLGTIVPVDTAAYLRTHGWRGGGPQKTCSTLSGSTAFGGEDFEILLPLDRSFRDYPLRTAELLSTLELAEGRSQLEILRDISTTFADVIRIRSQHEGSKDGSLSLEGGVSLVENTRELLLGRRLLHRFPSDLTSLPASRMRRLHYVEKLRMGQTERGSYVMDRSISRASYFARRPLRGRRPPGIGRAVRAAGDEDVDEGDRRLARKQRTRSAATGRYPAVPRGSAAWRKRQTCAMRWWVSRKEPTQNGWRSG